MRAMGLGLTAAALVSLLTCPVAAQPPAPPTAETESGAEPPTETSPPIIVTGSRPLVVNIDHVATRCNACLRALARISALASDTRPAPGRAPRSLDQGLPSVDLGMRAPVDTATGGAREMMRYTEHQTRARITAREAPPPGPRVDPDALARQYLQNLLSYVGPIVDRRLRETGAPAAYSADDPATRGLAMTDITDFVVAVLDREHAGIDLLARRQP